MGIPQGRVLSVTRFALKINTIVKAIPPCVECSLYVDDFLIVFFLATHTLLCAFHSALLSCCHTGLTQMASNSQAAKQFVCISADFAMLIQIQNLRSMVLSSLLLNKPNSSESFFTIKLTFLPHIRYLKEKCVKVLNFLRVVAHTSWGADQHTLSYIFIDRLFVLSSTMAVLSMVLRENLTYVCWILYRTMHCDYASVPPEVHLPQVCVFKPMNLHSTYGEEC